MKQHLFYTFLILFIATAIITLLGVTNVLPIDDQYLWPLVVAFLLELSVGVIFVYKKADFFNDSFEKNYDFPKIEPTSNSINEDAETNRPATSLSSHSEQADREDSDAGANSVQEYRDLLKANKHRYYERDKLIEETKGKQMQYIGRLREVEKFDGGVMLTLIDLDDPYEVLIATAPHEHMNYAYTFHKDDIIEVSGTARPSITSLNLYNATFRLNASHQPENAPKSDMQR